MERKGQIEKDHEYIRYVLPSGTSFDGLTQEKVDLLMNHINNTAEKLGIQIIDADDICLKPVLLK